MSAGTSPTPEVRAQMLQGANENERERLERIWARLDYIPSPDAVQYDGPRDSEGNPDRACYRTWEATRQGPFSRQDLEQWRWTGGTTPLDKALSILVNFALEPRTNVNPNPAFGRFDLTDFSRSVTEMQTVFRLHRDALLFLWADFDACREHDADFFEAQAKAMREGYDAMSDYTRKAREWGDETPEAPPTAEEKKARIMELRKAFSGPDKPLSKIGTALNMLSHEAFGQEGDEDSRSNPFEDGSCDAADMKANFAVIEVCRIALDELERMGHAYIEEQREYFQQQAKDFDSLAGGEA